MWSRAIDSRWIALDSIVDARRPLNGFIVWLEPLFLLLLPDSVWPAR